MKRQYEEEQKKEEDEQKKKKKKKKKKKGNKKIVNISFSRWVVINAVKCLGKSGPIGKK